MKYLRIEEEIDISKLEERGITIHSERRYEGLGIVEYEVTGIPKDFEYFDDLYDNPLWR